MRHKDFQRKTAPPSTVYYEKMKVKSIRGRNIYRMLRKLTFYSWRVFPCSPSHQFFNVSTEIIIVPLPKTHTCVLVSFRRFGYRRMDGMGCKRSVYSVHVPRSYLISSEKIGCNRFTITLYRRGALELTRTPVSDLFRHRTDVPDRNIYSLQPFGLIEMNTI